MTTEVEERIHKALETHPLERLADGYRRVHPGAGIGTLRLLPFNLVQGGLQVVAVAEVLAEYSPGSVPAFSPLGVQRLNAMAVYGPYELRGGQLRQTAQYSIYANEPAAHLAAQSVLNAFGGQLPIGRSVALSTLSVAKHDEQRAHHNMPRQWAVPVPEESLQSAAQQLQQRGLSASHDATSVWAELALSGDCPSRAIDPTAETAAVHVYTGIPHPIAGVGYLSTISLPPGKSPRNAVEISRRLNAAELEQVDFAPRLGAWGLHGPDDLLAYSSFLPCAEPKINLHLTLLWWCALRAAWLRDRYWVADQGIVLDKPGAGAPQNPVPEGSGPPA